jgi:hypothetical protein
MAPTVGPPPLTGCAPMEKGQVQVIAELRQRVDEQARTLDTLRTVVEQRAIQAQPALARRASWLGRLFGGRDDRAGASSSLVRGV